MFWIWSVPQGPCENVLVPALHYWEVVDTFKRWGLVEGFMPFGDMPWKRICGINSHFFSLLASMWHEVSILLYLIFSTVICCLTIGPKALGPTSRGLKCLKLWAQINLSSFWVDCFRYFVTVTKSLLI